MKILLIYQHEASFVRDDLDLLSEFGDVVAFPFGSYKTREALGLASRLREQSGWLATELPSADLVVGWFVDYHMALPIRRAVKIGKPVAICVGGFDANRVPSLGYGLFENKWRAKIAEYIYRNVSLVLPVTESLLQSENTYSEYPNILRTGIRENVRSFDRPVQVLPTGYDSAKWAFGASPRSNVVLSVAAVSTMRTFLLKGLDLVLATAQTMGDLEFRILGITEGVQQLARDKYVVPDNVLLLPPVPRQDLVAEYQNASVFLHLSRAEGMPNVLCESMLCGCYPVASNVFGNPAAVGSTGLLVDLPVVETICSAVAEGMRASDRERLACREHVESNFSRNHRKRGWEQVISRLCQ